MNSEKLKIQAQVFLGEDSPNIVEIANKKGIILPSTHLAIFKSVYAPIEEANDNGIRLARSAVEKALPGIVGSQVNLEHFGKGFMVGIILDAWLNANDEIEIAFTFAKNIYEDEYLRALGRLQEGKLSVSFELMSSRGSQEHLSDGTIRLNDIDFQGVGLLIDETPAYKKAITYEVANIRKRALTESNSQFICANQIVKACDDVLAETIDNPKFILVTTSEENHFHLAEIDFDGNGQTFDTVGNTEEHTHSIKNFQIQGDKHTHRILAEMLAKLQKHLSNKQDKSLKDKTEDKLGGNINMNEEEQKKVSELRAELGDFASNVSDEDLLKEEKQEELRKAKEDAEKEAKPEGEVENEVEADTEVKAEETEKETEPEAEAKKDAEPEAEVNELEEAQKRIAELETEVEGLKATIESKNSEIEIAKTNATKIATLKVELKNNPHVKDFKDEDFLDEAKVEKAKLLKENDDLKVAVEQAKKDKVEASDKSMETGHEEDVTDDVSKILAKKYRNQ